MQTASVLHPNGEAGVLVIVIVSVQQPSQTLYMLQYIITKEFGMGGTPDFDDIAAQHVSEGDKLGQ
jgi:hypothetical protein